MEGFDFLVIIDSSPKIEPDCILIFSESLWITQIRYGREKIQFHFNPIERWFKYVSKTHIDDNDVYDIIAVFVGMIVNEEGVENLESIYFKS